MRSSLYHDIIIVQMELWSPPGLIPVRYLLVIDEKNHLGTSTVFEVLVIIDKSQVHFLVIWGLIYWVFFFENMFFGLSKELNTH